MRLLKTCYKNNFVIIYNIIDDLACSLIICGKLNFEQKLMCGKTEKSFNAQRALTHLLTFIYKCTYNY